MSISSVFKVITPIEDQPTLGLQNVLRKEAVYTAVGRCASRLKDFLNFEDFLQATLVRDSRNESQEWVRKSERVLKLTNTFRFPIIKRRIAWLLGRWVHDHATSPSNPQLWDILVYLLKDRGPGTDAVVRLTTATALKDCFDVNSLTIFR